MKRSHRVYDAVKRTADVLASAVLLVVLSPLLLVVALLVRVKLGSPVLFRQQRPGRGGRVFTLYKFRTMTHAADGAKELAGSAAAVAGSAGDVAAVATDAARLTPFGSFLRASSIDELPELVNVLRGEMSIVGPRPLLTEYLDRYAPEQARRHDVRPGITGWAQVNGRNAVAWEERFALDVWYVDNRSLALDLKVLWMTVATLFKREGISAEGHATMEPFDPARTAGLPREDS